MGRGGEGRVEEGGEGRGGERREGRDRQKVRPSTQMQKSAPMTA